jgi:hypothetical protein
LPDFQDNHLLKNTKGKKRLNTIPHTNPAPTNSYHQKQNLPIEWTRHLSPSKPDAPAAACPPAQNDSPTREPAIFNIKEKNDTLKPEDSGNPGGTRDAARSMTRDAARENRLKCGRYPGCGHEHSLGRLQLTKDNHRAISRTL